MSTRLPRRLTLAAALALAIAACGSSATPSPTAAPTATPTASPSAAPTPSPTASPTTEPTATASAVSGRTGRIELTDIAVAVTLPDGWVEVGLTESDIELLLENLPDKTQAEALKAQIPTLIAAGVKLWAFDVTAEGAGSNLIVISQPGALPASLLKQFAQQGIGQAPGVEGVKVSDVKVDGADAVRIDYNVSQAGSAASGTQVYASANSNLYIFTVTIPNGGSTTDSDAIVKSIDFLD